MSKRTSYAYLREVGLSPWKAAWRVLLPTRVAVALHVLRGRPTMYRWHHVGQLVIDQSNALVADSVVDGGSYTIEVPASFTYEVPE